MPMRVAVCVITFRRSEYLGHLLESLANLQFKKTAKPELTIIVVDNDKDGSAREICDRQRAKLNLQIDYSIEPNQGISNARNMALRAVPADADFIAMIDDDERACEYWLDELLTCAVETGAACVTGPIIPNFPADTPGWIIDGRFFDRPRPPDRSELPASKTGNALVHAATWRETKLYFDEDQGFMGSEDTLFFLQGKRLGWRIVWADDAVVFEEQPRLRLNAAWIIRRQFQMGNGLAHRDRILYGWRYMVLFRGARAWAYLFLGITDLVAAMVGGKKIWVRGLAKIARSIGGFLAVFGHTFQAYAPSRVARDRSELAHQPSAKPSSTLEDIAR